MIITVFNKKIVSEPLKFPLFHVNSFYCSQNFKARYAFELFLELSPSPGLLLSQVFNDQTLAQVSVTAYLVTLCTENHLRGINYFTFVLKWLSLS